MVCAEMQRDMSERELVLMRARYARLRTAINAATVVEALTSLLWLSSAVRDAGGLLLIPVLAVPFGLVIYVGRAMLLVLVDIADGVAELRQRPRERDPEV
jgi:hypothetical protein